jgi:calcineurin-like phosphoesterase family protein
MIYFTGDQHFGHANIIKHCNRPFESVADMDVYLLEQWNERVGGNDTIYILGDLFFRNAVSTEEYLGRLHGKKHLIVGNHDRDWMKKADLQKYFLSVSNMLETSDGAHKLILCHYPMMTWNGSSKGSYLIYGHIHNNTNAAYYPLLRSMPNALNAGVDVNHFRPVNFTELVKNNEEFRDSAVLA